MCRLLGVVSSVAADFRFSLNDATWSLASQSRLHPHGWGLAVHDASWGWTVQKEPACAGEDARFAQLAATARGTLLIAHVRKRTVGTVSRANTHPFCRGRWVFAHNGTIELPHRDALAARTSRERRAEIEGETDSEALFAFLLTRLDEAEVESAPADARTDSVLSAAVRELSAREGLGAVNFLLSDGTALYAHRAGRTLHLLERGAGDAVRRRRVSVETSAVLETTWTRRRVAILLASERMSDEPWQELPEGALLRLDGGASPRWTRLDLAPTPPESTSVPVPVPVPENL